jgi:hypothetical protein
VAERFQQLMELFDECDAGDGEGDVASDDEMQDADDN